jgi:Tfp pilus assembly protein PilE
VNDYLRFVRDTDVGTDLVDEIELPLPKRILVEAFKDVIVAEERREVRALLLKAALTLSQYHVRLGERIRIRATTAFEMPASTDSRLALRFNRTLQATAVERSRLNEIFRIALKLSTH